MILVSAAAGFGKTTLASEWITEGHLDGSVAWVSLDEEDNHPTRFLFYLIAALQQVDAQLGENILPVLQSPQLPQFTELIEQLLNQIAASEKKVVLFLDDYHLVTSDGVHQLVQRAIERQPGNMHTVILTREDPPLPLPRMRVRGQVIEVRERDLRFSLPEAQSFLVEAMGLDLSADEVGKLKERTEGWVAGMQLAALALEDYLGKEDRRTFIDAFTGSDRFIIDYLVSEVLNRQSEAIRAFLLNTAILDRFCSDLCDQVVYGKVGDGRSQSMLDSLELGNMFLVPLDNQRQWYRYHHLFAEMLGHSLRRSAPDQVPALYRRAGEWFEARGLTSEAMKYATAYGSATGDWDFSGALLDQYAMRMILQGQGNLVMNWCQPLPKIYLQKAPEICIYFAWALVLTFRTDYLEAVEEKLQWALQAIETSDLPTNAQVGQDGALVPLRDWVTGQVCVIRSQILLGRFHTYIDPQELISLSLTGLDLLPETEKAVRAICKINLAHAQLIQSNAIEAQKAFEEALPFMMEAGNYLGGVTSIFYQVRLAYYLGQLDHAEALCRQWKEKFVAMAGPNRNDIPAIRGLDMVLSILLVERGQVEAAEQLLVQALDLPSGASWMEILGFISLARLRFLRGDRDGADEILRRMANMGPQHASCAEALRILFALRNSPGNPQLRTRAEAWARMVAPDPAFPFSLGIGPYHCDVEYFCNIAWAQIQIALGNPREALVFVKPALASAKDHHLTFRILELTIIQAFAYETAGRMSFAMAEFDKALDIAQTYGYKRIFAEGPDTSGLLQKSAQRSSHQHFASQLLDSFYPPLVSRRMIETSTKKESRPSIRTESPIIELSALIEPAVLIEPVSERELDVLHLIAAGFSNGQIAERLYIAQGTVKRHITHLYGKLAVKSRTQAIARAREIGLL